MYDSAHSQVEIVTDSNTVQKLHVDKDGNIDFSGKAKSIKVTGAITHNKTENKTRQESKGKTTNITTADSMAQSTQIHQLVKNKTVDAKADHSWVYGLIGVFALVIIGALIYLRGIKAI